MRLFEELLKIRVYCVPGTSLFYDQAGWFRFTFAHPKKYAQLGKCMLQGQIQDLAKRGSGELLTTTMWHFRTHTHDVFASI